MKQLLNTLGAIFTLIALAIICLFGYGLYEAMFSHLENSWKYFPQFALISALLLGASAALAIAFYESAEKLSKVKA